MISALLRRSDPGDGSCSSLSVRRIRAAKGSGRNAPVVPSDAVVGGCAAMSTSKTSAGGSRVAGPVVGRRGST